MAVDVLEGCSKVWLNCVRFASTCGYTEGSKRWKAGSATAIACVSSNRVSLGVVSPSTQDPKLAWCAGPASVVFGAPRGVALMLAPDLGRRLFIIEREPQLARDLPPGAVIAPLPDQVVPLRSGQLPP